MPDVPEITEVPEVSTEAQRQALDTMSEELVQKLNRMIEEQDARVKEFAVQNPSLSSLPVTPDPIVLPHPAMQPQQPSVPKPAAIAAEQLPEEYQRPQAKERRVGMPEKPRQTPPVPDLNRPKPKRQRQVAPNQEEKQSSGIGSWIFFIVVVLIILRSCTE